MVEYPQGWRAPLLSPAVVPLDVTGKDVKTQNEIVQDYKRVSFRGFVEHLQFNFTNLETKQDEIIIGKSHFKIFVPNLFKNPNFFSLYWSHWQSLP